MPGYSRFHPGVLFAVSYTALAGFLQTSESCCEASAQRQPLVHRRLVKPSPRSSRARPRELTGPDTKAMPKPQSQVSDAFTKAEPIDIEPDVQTLELLAGEVESKCYIAALIECSNRDGKREFLDRVRKDIQSHCQMIDALGTALQSPAFDKSPEQSQRISAVMSKLRRTPTGYFYFASSHARPRVLRKDPLQMQLPEQRLLDGMDALDQFN